MKWIQTKVLSYEDSEIKYLLWFHEYVLYTLLCVLSHEKGNCLYSTFNHIRALSTIIRWSQFLCCDYLYVYVCLWVVTFYFLGNEIFIGHCWFDFHCYQFWQSKNVPPFCANESIHVKKKQNVTRNILESEIQVPFKCCFCPMVGHIIFIAA